jgi:Zn-dependent peptidase ImmA (M78 family)
LKNKKTSKNKNNIPVNPALLVWARETAGYVIDDLITEFPKLLEWESGNKGPTYNQLESLAAKYHRPIALFFFPDPPKEDDIKKSLRAISEYEIDSLSPHIRYLFRKAKSFQIKLRELSVDQELEQKRKISWLQNTSNLSIKDLALQVRKFLNITIDQQLSWNDSDVALKEWRKVLALNGVYVFKEAFKNDKISGFCIYDDTFPIIFINNSHSKNRQIFTLFHELAHLLFHDSHLDILDNRIWDIEVENPNHIEVKCNKFAGHFLIPENYFLTHYSHNEISDVLISKIAEHFKVSRDVVLRKMFDNNLIDRSQFLNTIEEWTKKKKDTKRDKGKKSSGSYYNNQMSYLGDAYLSLVFSNYHQGKLNIEKATEYLGISVKSFSGVEDRFLQRGISRL